MGPFPSRPILGSIRGEGTSTNPSRHLRKTRENSHLSDFSKKVEEGVQPPLTLLAPPSRPHTHVPMLQPPPPLQPVLTANLVSWPPCRHRHRPRHSVPSLLPPCAVAATSLCRCRRPMPPLLPPCAVITATLGCNRCRLAPPSPSPWL